MINKTFEIKKASKYRQVAPSPKSLTAMGERIKTKISNARDERLTVHVRSRNSFSRASASFGLSRLAISFSIWALRSEGGLFFNRRKNSTVATASLSDELKKKNFWLMIIFRSSVAMCRMSSNAQNSSRTAPEINIGSSAIPSGDSRIDIEDETIISLRNTNGNMKATVARGEMCGLVTMPRARAGLDQSRKPTVPALTQTKHSAM